MSNRCSLLPGWHLRLLIGHVRPSLLPFFQTKIKNSLVTFVVAPVVKSPRPILGFSCRVTASKLGLTFTREKEMVEEEEKY